MNAPERRFAYRAVRPDGGAVADVVSALDRRDALRRLARIRLQVTELRDLAPAREAGRRTRRVSPRERVLVLRQLAVMTGAGVDLLEALETIASALPGRAVADGLRTAATALRRGDRIASAVAEGLPGYPTHVYALIRAGEASGQLPRVLGEAARQVEAEARARREFADALTYPAFLTCAGMLVVGFLFYAVVPRFAQMLGPVRGQVDGLQNLVLSLGEGFHRHAVLVLATLGAAAAVTGAVLSDAGVRRAGVEALTRVPGLGRIVIRHRRAGWARIMAFSLGAGVGLLEAAELAAASLPDGRFRRGLDEAAGAFRAGKSPAEAFAAAGALSATDVSLLRAGQRSGVLAEMFQVIADAYEEDLRTTLKRAAVVAEQAAIACVASAIGAVVLSLVTALTALYDSVG